MNFLKQLIRQFLNKRIKMLGRAGILYKGDLDTYLVNSERLVGPPDVVVFTDDIRFSDEKKKDIILSDKEKQAIAQQVKVELEEMGMSVEIS